MFNPNTGKFEEVYSYTMSGFTEWKLKQEKIFEAKNHML
jgi:hypothetical protein